MKQLMLGNAAVARGLYEAGCCVISSYPGTPSTEITEEAAKFDDIYCEWAPNEKVAMEVAFGASLAGKRSFCAMKHVGLNVAADPLFTVAYTGVNAGMVIAVADDPGMHSSQNEQDSRHYAIAAKLPMLEPADSAEALAFTRRAYEISEEFDTPVILKMCTRVAHSQSIVETSPRTEGPERPYEKNIAKYVMMPGNAIRRHPVVEDRMRRLAQYAETCDLNRVEMGDTKLGIITSSTSYQYVKEVFGEEASVLKLGMVHPMPEGLIRDFAAKVDRLVVVEELDPIIENYCRQLGLTVSGKEALPLEGEFSQNLVAAKLGGAVHTGTALEDAIPPRPPGMGAGVRTRRPQRGPPVSGQGAPPGGGGFPPDPGAPRAGGRGPPRPRPGGPPPAPPAGDVRRLSSPRTVLHPGKKQVYRAGRHRLLHPGGGGPSERHGDDPLHGRLHQRHPRLQQGIGGEKRGEDGGRHRRLHLLALRHDRPGQHRL